MLPLILTAALAWQGHSREHASQEPRRQARVLWEGRGERQGVKTVKAIHANFNTIALWNRKPAAEI